MMTENCDNWKHRRAGMRCSTCISFVPKVLQEVHEKEATATRKPVLGRCRRYAPTMRGWPVIFESDWCGEHRLDEEKL